MIDHRMVETSPLAFENLTHRTMHARIAAGTREAILSGTSREWEPSAVSRVCEERSARTLGPPLTLLPAQKEKGVGVS